MKYCATEKLSLTIRILLLMICCTLFLPQGMQDAQKRSMDEGIRNVTIALAITSITNHVARIQSFVESERTSLNAPGKRSAQPSTSSGEESESSRPSSFPPLPGTFILARSLFGEALLPPVSHGLFNWFALAPPASRNN